MLGPLPPWPELMTHSLQSLALVRHRPRFAQALDLGTQESRALHVVRAEARGVQVQVPAGWTSVWIALSGTPRFDAAWSDWELGQGQLMTWTDGVIRASNPCPAWWLLLAAPTSHWSGFRGDPRMAHALDLVPWQAECPREIRRAIVRLARSTSGDPDPTTLVGMLDAMLHEQQQATVQRWLSNCSGRTLQRKQQSLVRLLRVRRIVQSNLESRLDLASLAEFANYSPHHLIRVYRNVFDETPTEYAMRLRTQRAWTLVRDTRMPICEITDLLGFESQSAFCRAFKHAFGMTTGQARRLHTVRTGHWQERRIALSCEQPKAA